MSLQSIVQQVFPYFLYEAEPEVVEVRAVPVSIQVRDWEQWGNAKMWTPGLATHLFVDSSGMVWVYVTYAYAPRRHMRPEATWIELGRVTARTHYVDWCDYRLGGIANCDAFDAVSTTVYQGFTDQSPAHMLRTLQSFLPYI